MSVATAGKCPDPVSSASVALPQRRLYSKGETHHGEQENDEIQGPGEEGQGS